MNTREFCCDDACIGQRLDSWLSKTSGLSRNHVQKLLYTSQILVNNLPVSKNYQMRQNDHVTVILPEPVEDKAIPENIPLDIVYEDDWLLVVNKPKGMVVHPAAGNRDGTLVNALLYHCKESLSGIGGVMRPGIVHRIDKDTSGLLMVAKNDMAHQKLSEQIKAHSFKREYAAVVYGNVKADSGIINAPIGRNATDRKKMAVTTKNARDAVTHFQVEARYAGFTFLTLRLETGRTHQIRVHLNYIGHPVAGDMVYGPKKTIKSLSGQCLHAKTIGFCHPADGRYMEFTSPLPAYFVKFLAALQEQ